MMDRARVFAEKRREDALRTQLSSMARWVWDEVLPARTFFRFLTKHDVSRARPSRRVAVSGPAKTARAR